MDRAAVAGPITLLGAASSSSEVEVSDPATGSGEAAKAEPHGEAGSSSSRAAGTALEAEEIKKVLEGGDRR